MTISSNDVEKKYMQALECMRYNEEAALNEKTNHPHATWIQHPTLARWLYGSSQEFLKDFSEASRKLKYQTPEQRDEIEEWHGELAARVEEFRTRLKDKFPDDSFKKEALK